LTKSKTIDAVNVSSLTTDQLASEDLTRQGQGRISTSAFTRPTRTTVMAFGGPNTQYSMNVDGIEEIDLTQDAADSRKRARTKAAENLASDIPYPSIEDENETIPLFNPDVKEEDEDSSDCAELTEREIVDFKAAYESTAAETVPASESRDSVTALGDAKLRVGMDVELHDGDFLRIKRIRRDALQILLNGILLRRTRFAEDMLNKKYNEVFAIVKNHTGGKDPDVNGFLVTRPISAVVAVRKITFTNLSFPRLSFREGATHYASWDDVMDHAPLVCRWKCVEFCDERNAIVEGAVVGLRRDECDDLCGIPQGDLRGMWRASSTSGAEVKKSSGGGKSTFGFKRGMKRSRADQDEPVDLTKTADDEDTQEIFTTTTITQCSTHIKRHSVVEATSNSTVTERMTFKPNMKTPSNAKASAHSNGSFTYGDLFSGAGGMAEGAAQAGLVIKYLLDHWNDAVETLERNWPDAKIFRLDIYSFLITQRGEFRVDILHISFPCQPHSSAHTREGKNDDANIAAGYSVQPILEKFKPRVVTLEQTSGIKTHNGGFHFRALVHQLTAAGYNVRWKIIHCNEYGNCQDRKRLIIIASCPGETLPPFPKPTHGNGPGLKPFVTIRDRLSKIHKSMVEGHMSRHGDKRGTPFNADRPLRSCITTDGGTDQLHPSGKRSYKLQELACLAGFPATHRFSKTGPTSIKKQIGNAVPSCVAKAIFKRIVKTMKETDQAIAEESRDIVEID
jgi:DNA (cytosine-5)-methyltransferase 1